MREWRIGLLDGILSDRRWRLGLLLYWIPWRNQRIFRRTPVSLSSSYAKSRYSPRHNRIPKRRVYDSQPCPQHQADKRLFARLRNPFRKNVRRTSKTKTPRGFSDFYLRRVPDSHFDWSDVFLVPVANHQYADFQIFRLFENTQRRWKYEPLWYYVEKRDLWAILFWVHQGNDIHIKWRH